MERVDVALRGEVHHRARLVAGEQALDQGAVADVAMHEEVPLTSPSRRERLVAVAGVGQRVEVDHRLVRTLGASRGTKFAPMKPAPPVTRITWESCSSLESRHYRIQGNGRRGKDATRITGFESAHRCVLGNHCGDRAMPAATSAERSGSQKFSGVASSSERLRGKAKERASLDAYPMSRAVFWRSA